jgi:hypothetical protein
MKEKSIAIISLGHVGLPLAVEFGKQRPVVGFDINPGTPLILPGKSEFAAILGESVNCAAMERCPASNFPDYIVRLDASWNDLGLWDAVWNVLPKDENGNACVGDVPNTITFKSITNSRALDGDRCNSLGPKWVQCHRAG